MRSLVAATLVALVACTPPEEGPGPKPDEATTPTGTTSPPTTTPPTTDTAPTDTAPTDTGTPPLYDCTVLPPLPAPVTILNGFFGAEDFDFSHDGYAVAVDNGNLVGRNNYGDAILVASNVATSPSGTRLMHDGTWLVADQSDGALRHIDPVTGSKEVVYTGAWPNGVEVDGDQVYVSDFSLGKLSTFDINDPAGTMEVIHSQLSSPNGVVLSPDGQTLYVVVTGEGGVDAFDRQIDGSWGPKREFHRAPGGNYQGINVDICGNVYASDVSRMVRLTPDGLQTDLVLESGYLPNMRWGHDVGGFGATVLYGIDWGADALWAMEMGIVGKPHVQGP